MYIYCDQKSIFWIIFINWENYPSVNWLQFKRRSFPKIVAGPNTYIYAIYAYIAIYGPNMKPDNVRVAGFVLYAHWKQNQDGRPSQLRENAPRCQGKTSIQFTLIVVNIFLFAAFLLAIGFFFINFFYLYLYKCAFFIYWRPSQEIRNLTNMCSAPLRGISDTIIAMNDTEQPGKYATMKRGKGSIFIKIYFISPIRIYNYYSLYF